MPSFSLCVCLMCVRLQLEELLANVGVKAARLKEFGPLLIAINETLNSLTDRHIPADFASEFPSLVFHSILPAGFTFTRPARVDVVGSYVLKAVTKPVTNIDMAMEMPKDTFLERDHINYRCVRVCGGGGAVAFTLLVSASGRWCLQVFRQACCVSR